jgi:hypothetical protein
MSDVIDCMTWDDRITNYERVTGFPRSCSLLPMVG